MRTAIKVLIFFLFVFFLIVPMTVYFPEPICLGVSKLSFFTEIALLGVLIFGILSWYIILLIYLRKILQKEFWRGLLAGLSACLLTVATFILMFYLNNFLLRQAAFRAAERGQLIIQEIEKFRLKNGSFPTRFSDLNVKIPSTNICGYKNFEYVASADKPQSLEKFADKMGEDGGTLMVNAAQDTGGYELYINMSRGLLNWDVLVYWPSKAYPKSMKGGWVQLFGDWAYVHE